MEISNSLKERLLFILKKLIQIPSQNPPGKTEDIVNFMVKEVFKEEEGFHNEVITHMKNGVELHNLVTKIGSGKKEIVLSGHFDVVPVGDQTKWSYPPFSAKIVHGKIYGRGSADMKGGLTSLIGVMKVLNSDPYFMENYELVFLGTADEEAGMTGSDVLSKKGFVKNADLIIIAEPTNLNIGVAGKGLLWATLQVTGKSAHGSMPDMGYNAIEGILKIIPQIYNCLEDKSNKILGRSTINIGKIHGGTKINIVPDYAELEIDFRLIPEQEHEKVINNLRKIELNPYSINVNITNSLQSLLTDINHPFIQNLKNITNSEFIGLSYATDACVYVNPSNFIPFVIFGPGDPNIVHKPNEWIQLEQIFYATEFLIDALKKTYLK
ncbi:MAG: M20 family metallopeptidase [Candidatus Lokiarchaeota archaeon]|nr:M20 family metallopeptidase [Candidatus Lokiarchaeota archaeon]